LNSGGGRVKRAKPIEPFEEFMSTFGKKFFSRGGLLVGLLGLVGCDEAPTIVEGHSAGPIVA
jgi:hypothetical protein